MYEEITIQEALKIKPQAKALLDLADYFRRYRWNNKIVGYIFCQFDTLETHFDKQLEKMFNRDNDDENEAYIAVHWTIIRKLPSCHNCSCGWEQERGLLENHYWEVYESHYDLEKSAKEKRAEFDLLKRKPEFQAFLLTRMRKQNFLCFYCKGHLDNTYHIDHRVPLSKGGSNNKANLVATCSQCNLKKHDKVEEDFGFDPEYANWMSLHYKEDLWLPVLSM